MILDKTPQDFDEIEFGGVSGQKIEEQAHLLPGVPFFLKCLTGMNGRIVDNDHSFSGDRLAKKIKAADHRVGGNTALHTERGEIIIGGKKAQHIEPLPLARRNLDGFPLRLPGIGNTRIQRKAGFVKVNQVKGSGLLFFLTLLSLFSPEQTRHHLVCS